ncbi:hypothetical protein LOTGIDRAFT_162953 [Lottia gigantea]|uniref:EF-hand domain-containing protein n=1 Tax=Lottia gigantea TaxID=225164 RepID=V4BSK6_LOTGI|nr:hypothetical protein LOTGIDRAFT_162953 [Lottia gigantea]ESO91949.1 hypothetical protein LOTGIDRAFT_162953 [Lottia gigantea]
MAENILSDLERAIYSAFFEAADKNKDGYLSLDELTSVIKRCGINLAQKEWAETFIEMDLNCDWKITLDEFITGMHSLRPGKRRVAKLNRELTGCDSGGAGFLSHKVIENIAREKSEITETEIENTFKHLNADDLNKINYKQFVNVLEKIITD